MPDALEPPSSLQMRSELETMIRRHSALGYMSRDQFEQALTVGAN